MFAESQVLHMVSVCHNKESGISTIDSIEEIIITHLAVQLMVLRFIIKIIFGPFAS
jgi:hypothetical protein